MFPKKGVLGSVLARLFFIWKVNNKWKDSAHLLQRNREIGLRQWSPTKAYRHTKKGKKRKVKIIDLEFIKKGGPRLGKIEIFTLLRYE